MNLSILYRGPLTSCNYACRYCPFAKRTESRAQLDRDRLSLRRFTAWLGESSSHHFRVLFTPWGEALVRIWYRRAVTQLTHVPHLESVSIQTNLSCSLGWVDECRLDRLAFWATFHPTEADRATFVRKVNHLTAIGVRVSAGAVGVPAHIDEIARLRDELAPEVYLWINAQQPRSRPYSDAERARFTSIDPLFGLTARRHLSRGKPCRTGERVFTVDGDGDMRRCHFVDQVIGNVYTSDWEAALRPRPCPNACCDCFVGFAHLVPLELEKVFGDYLLERVVPMNHSRRARPRSRRRAWND